MTAWFDVGLSARQRHVLYVRTYEQIAYEIYRRRRYCGTPIEIIEAYRFWEDHFCIANSHVAYREGKGGTLTAVAITLRGLMLRVVNIATDSESNPGTEYAFVDPDGSRYSGPGSVASGFDYEGFSAEHDPRYPQNWTRWISKIREVLDALRYQKKRQGVAVERNMVEGERILGQSPVMWGQRITWPDGGGPSPNYSPGLNVNRGDQSPDESIAGQNPLILSAPGGYWAETTEGVHRYAIGWYPTTYAYRWWESRNAYRGVFRLERPEVDEMENTEVTGLDPQYETKNVTGGYIDLFSYNFDNYSRASIPQGHTYLSDDLSVAVYCNEAEMFRISKTEMVEHGALSGETGTEYLRYEVGRGVPRVKNSMDLSQFGDPGEEIEIIVRIENHRRGTPFHTWVCDQSKYEHGDPIAAVARVRDVEIGHAWKQIYRLKEFNYSAEWSIAEEALWAQSTETESEE